MEICLNAEAFFYCKIFIFFFLWLQMKKVHFCFSDILTRYG